MSEGSPISIDEYCLSSDSSSSIKEYCLSTDSQFSIDEYCLSTDSPYSIDKYFLSPSSPEPLLNKESCEEFCIEEYDINKITDNEDNDNEISMITGGQPNDNEIGCNVATPIAREENKSRSPMHIKPRRIRVARFNLVTSDEQVGLDVNKTCCARGCMSLIGKSKLRELRRFYFSMTGDEQDTTSAHICNWFQKNLRG